VVGREICSAGGLMDWNPQFREIGINGLVFIINGHHTLCMILKEGTNRTQLWYKDDRTLPSN
jgi:hypothetical protein